jgi:hypothetical protein
MLFQWLEEHSKVQGRIIRPLLSRSIRSDILNSSVYIIMFLRRLQRHGEELSFEFSNCKVTGAQRAGKGVRSIHGTRLTVQWNEAYEMGR